MLSKPHHQLVSEPATFIVPANQFLKLDSFFDERNQVPFYFLDN